MRSLTLPPIARRGRRDLAAACLKRALVWAWACAAVASPAVAQPPAPETDAPPRLPETVVETAPEATTPSTTTAAAPNPLPTATGQPGPGSLGTPNFEQALANAQGAIGGVGLVDQRVALQWKLSNQADLFRLTPGVWVSSQNGGDDVALSIRGSGINNGVSFGRGINSYIDGFLPAGRVDTGTTNQLINLMANQYVEVYRGSSALELGSTTLFGLVNYVPHTGYTADPLTYRTEFGPDNFLHQWIAAGNADNGTDGFFSFDSLTYDGYRQQGQQENYRLHVNFGLQGEDWETRTYVFANRARLELPGVVTKSQAAANPRQAGLFNSFLDTDRNWRAIRLGNKTTLQLDPDTQVQLGSFGAYEELDHLPTPFVGIIDNDYREWGLSLRAEQFGTLLGLENRVVFGTRYAAADNELNRYRYTNAGRDPVRSQSVFDATQRARTVEVFLQDEWSVVEAARLVIGAQFFHTDRIFHDRALVALPTAVPPFPPQPNVTVGDQSFEENYDQFNPKVGFNADLTDALILYGNVSRGAEAPNSTELENRAAFAFVPAFAGQLNAQEAWTPEVGLRGTLLESVDLDLAYYHSFIRDELLFRQGPFLNTTVAFNAGRTVHEGVELGARTDLVDSIFTPATRTRPADRLQLLAVYNWFNFYFDDDPTFGNNRLPGIPEHTLFTSLDYYHPSGFSIGPNLTAVSRYGLTFDGTGGDAFEIEGYALLGLRIGYQPSDRLYVFADLRNLGDRQYLADGNLTPTAIGPQALVTPGIGKAFFFGLEYRR